MSEITGPNEALQPTIPLDEPAWMPPPAEPLPPAAPLLRPVPFEDLEALPSFWARVGAMFRLVFSNPMELFERVPATEGLGAPWRFLLLLSIPVFLVVAVVFFFGGMVIMLAALEKSGQGDSRAIAAIMPIIFGAILLLMPLFSFLGMVIGGALNHFFLWMWGGLRPGVGVGQSIRAYAYASAFLQIINLVVSFIPLVGFLVQIAGMVAIGMGMARMHKTDTWRGICAVLTPIVLVCCCMVPLLIMAIPFLKAIGNH